MFKYCFTFAAVAVTLATSFPAVAQQGRKSPHETISTMISGNRITLTYGRPYTKDPGSGQMRKVWGGLVPYGKAWRTGADEATTLVTQYPLQFGETVTPAGAYTLYTVPMETGASKLAFGKKIGGWGIPVDEKNDLARVDLKKDTLEKQVDQFTMALEKGADGGVIKMMWENTQFSAPFT